VLYFGEVTNIYLRKIKNGYHPEALEG